MEQKLSRSRIWLAVALVLMLISAIGASAVQTSGGKVTVKDLKFETAPGLMMSGLLFVPDGVSAENPAPAVVTSHGMYNNREMQDANFTELARRGFVVLSMDMYSHGWSEPTSDTGLVTTGMYQAAKMLNDLDYVAEGRVGITGHSLGGMSSNAAVMMDNDNGTDYIQAVLLNSADASHYDEDGDWVNVYGARDVGIIAPMYDEFFFFNADENGLPTTETRLWINDPAAQSFLNFGQGPGAEARESSVVYTEDVEGVEAMRVIYTPNIFHPWSHFSKKSTDATISFFDEALGAPNPIAPSNQVWQIKEAFNFVGLIGFGIFLVAFTVWMLRSRFFASLRAPSVVEARTTNRAGKAWFWGTSVAVAIFAILTYMPILMATKAHRSVAGWPKQSSPWGIAVWATAVGLFILLVLAVFYFAWGKKNGVDLKERGIAMPWKTVGKTVWLAVVVTAAAYATVFFVDYFFKTDFRLWVLAVKTFPPNILWVSLFPVLPMLAIFYVMASVAANSINYLRMGKDGKASEWVNTAIVAGFNAIPAVVLLVIQYGWYFTSGWMAFPAEKMPVVWLFTLIVILPVTTVISRKIYKVTNNPYLPGLINAFVVTLIASSNTLTFA